MTSRLRKNRLYKDMAWIWPLWGTTEVYRQESEWFTKLIKKHTRIDVKTLLDVGCGGGKNTFNLKKSFTVTGLDISAQMLENARALNPDCTFVKGDMRNFNLETQFDAIVINDSISYMTSREELLSLFKCTYRHLRSGGVMICCPDRTKENFKNNETKTDISHSENPQIVFVENNFDPDPSDDTYEGLIIYIIREDGQLRIESDMHILGLFEMDYWREAFKKAGYEVFEYKDTYDDSIADQDWMTFACLKKL